MDSINSEVTTLPTADTIMALHRAYNEATGFGTQFNAVFERQFFEAAKMGLTPEMFSLVLKERMRGVWKGDRKPACVMPRNLIATDDAVNEVLCEASQIMARKRVKLMDSARAEVMRATGRPTEMPTQQVRSSAEVLAKGWQQVRQAIQEAAGQ